MKESKIEWTKHTFNPWIGCTKVSPGCLHCYAETLMDTRYGRVKWGRGNDRSRTSSGNWKQPRRWNKEAAQVGERHRVFCASLADWLDDEVPRGWRMDLLDLIASTPHLDWLLLTKRPELWRKMMEIAWQHHQAGSQHLLGMSNAGAAMVRAWLDGVAPANVWVGTSAEDQQRWDERMPELDAIPAVVRFVSAEPLLGHIAMRGHRPDWLIVGGESGPGSRDMEAGWVKDLRDEAQAVGTKFFFKQWGGADKKAAGRELAGRTWDELPDHATYSREFGTGVARHLSSVLRAERVATAAVAGARGGSAGERTSGKAELSGAQECNGKADRSEPARPRSEAS